MVSKAFLVFGVMLAILSAVVVGAIVIHDGDQAQLQRLALENKSLQAQIQSLTTLRVLERAMAEKEAFRAMAVINRGGLIGSWFREYPEDQKPINAAISNALEMSSITPLKAVLMDENYVVVVFTMTRGEDVYIRVGRPGSYATYAVRGGPMLALESLVVTGQEASDIIARIWPAQKN